MQLTIQDKTRTYWDVAIGGRALVGCLDNKPARLIKIVIEVDRPTVFTFLVQGYGILNVNKFGEYNLPTAPHAWHPALLTFIME